MARDTEIRARVIRLLEGRGNVHDVSRLFSWLRFNSYGSAPIREIGHFASHPDKRVQDLVTNEMRVFFKYLRFRFPYLGGNPTDLSNLPATFRDVATTNIARIEDFIIRRDTGLRKKVASTKLSSALGKFSQKADGNYHLTEVLTYEEVLVFRCCLSYLISRPAFTDKNLSRDLRSVLLKNGLLPQEVKINFDLLETWVILYAISVMHSTEIALDDEWIGELRAGVEGGHLHVFGSAAIKHDLNSEEETVVSMTVFETSMKASDWRDPQLCPPSQSTWWRCPIDLIPGPRLSPLE